VQYVQEQQETQALQQRPQQHRPHDPAYIHGRLGQHLAHDAHHAALRPPVHALQSTNDASHGE
jgi:hypothetical protein